MAVEPAAAPAKIPARVVSLFGELDEIEQRLAAMPLTQAKELEKLEQRNEVEARQLAAERERLSSLPAGREQTLARAEITRLERSLEAEREREATLRELLPADPRWREEATQLRERARDVGREIGVARQLHLEASVAGPG